MIRLGVIGYGRRIRWVLDLIARYAHDATVVAVVDPQAAALRVAYPGPLGAATFYDDVDRMLDEADLDGVLIGTRCSLHAPFAVRVLRRGLPLFLEKPVATSWEQLSALRAAMERSSSPVVVSFPLRVSPMVQAARELIDGGAVGTVEHVQAVNNVPAYAAVYYHGWMRDEAETGGLWLQKATHDFDYLNALIGQRPTQICAMESKTVFRGDLPAGLKCAVCPSQADCPESPDNFADHQGLTAASERADWSCSFAVDTGNHDSASAIIAYASGLHAVYSQNFYARGSAAARGATLIGYRGTIKFDWYEGKLTLHHHRSGKVEQQRFGAGGEHGHHGGDEALARDFLAVIAGGGPSRAPLDAALLSAQMCLLARESSRTHSFREVRPLGMLAARPRPDRNRCRDSGRVTP